MDWEQVEDVLRMRLVQKEREYLFSNWQAFCKNPSKYSQAREIILQDLLEVSYSLLIK